MLDQAGDSVQALAIARGQAFPLVGPEVDGGPSHTWGPLYFVLLALPFAVSPDPAWAATFLAVLNLGAVYLTYITMRCERCKGPMQARRSTSREPYRFIEGGLPRVGLIGVTVYTCPQCGREGVTIPRLGQLHQAIAESLLAKPGPLEGDELRFLRKNAGIAAEQFAELLGIDPAHLSRVEHGKRELGTPTERLARAVVAAAMKRENLPAILLGLPGAKARAREKPPVFVMRGDTWRQQAA